MSFVRSVSKGKTAKGSHKYTMGTNKSPKVTKKKVKKKKPEWDSTQTDLDSYKASPEEQLRRKLSHLSNNVGAVKSDKFRKKIAKARKEKTPGSARKNKSAILREVLYDRSQLSDVLAKSDKAMAIVKDLFGDEPKRFRGHPNVTIAPDSSKQNFSQSILMSTTITEPSGLDMLSESVMDREALNDEDIVGQLVYSTDSEVEDFDQEPLSYQPRLDLSRFQRLLKLESDVPERDQKIEPPATLISKAQNMLQLETSPHDGSYLDDPITPVAPSRHEPRTPPDAIRRAATRTPDLPTVKAINDTEKVARAMSRLEPGRDKVKVKEVSPEVKEQETNMANLKKVLDGLHHNLDGYQGHAVTVSQPAALPAAPPASLPEPYSGCTQALISSISKLTTYLTEVQRKLQAEMILRDQLGQDVEHLRAVVDALTSDIITSQEETMMVSSEFKRYRLETDRHFQVLYNKLGIKYSPVRLPQANPRIYQGVQTRATDTMPTVVDSSMPRGQGHGHGNSILYSEPVSLPGMVNGIHPTAQVGVQQPMNGLSGYAGAPTNIHQAQITGEPVSGLTQDMLKSHQAGLMSGPETVMHDQMRVSREPGVATAPGMRGFDPQQNTHTNGDTLSMHSLITDTESEADSQSAFHRVSSHQRQYALNPHRPITGDPMRTVFQLTPPQQMDSPRTARTKSMRTTTTLPEKDPPRPVERREENPTDHPAAMMSRLAGGAYNPSQMAALAGQQNNNNGLFMPGSRQFELAPTLNNVDPAVRKSALQAAKSYVSRQSQLKGQSVNIRDVQKNTDVQGYVPGQKSDKKSQHDSASKTEVSAENGTTDLPDHIRRDLLTEIGNQHGVQGESLTEGSLREIPKSTDDHDVVRTAQQAQDTCRELLRKQMETLHRHHLEAQIKTRQIQLQPQVQKLNQAMPNQVARTRVPVSPSISPIPPEELDITDSMLKPQPLQLDENREAGGQKPGLSISLPSVQWTTPSPGQHYHEHTPDGNQNGGSPISACAIYQPQNVQVN